MLTYDTLIDAYSQGLQGIDKALLICHGPVAEAADIVLVQRQHGQTLADTSSQLQPASQVKPGKSSKPASEQARQASQASKPGKSSQPGKSA